MQSRGPSGENREYLFQLEEALEGLGSGSGDAHVSDLVRRCKEIENEGGEERGGGAVDEIGKVDRQEEVEK